MNIRKTILRLITASLLFIIISGCSSKPEENVILKMAVLPLLDNLPMYVAEEQGIFAEKNVNIEFIPVASAAERDQLIVSGHANGMINELVSTLFYNKEDIQIQVVRFARAATHEYPVFRILAASGSGISEINDLKGVEIGISEGTVIEYLTDRLLEAEGFSDEDIETIAVPRIPDRMALLGSGELQAAMLPDPLSSLAVLNGAKVILDDTTHPEFGYSVISFKKELIESSPDTIKAFLSAVEEATNLINANPGKWLELLSEKQLVPPPVMGSYEIPFFPTAGVPSELQWNDVLNWALDKGLLSTDVSYSDSVTSEYLP